MSMQKANINRIWQPKEWSSSTSFNLSKDGQTFRQAWSTSTSCKTTMAVIRYLPLCLLHRSRHRCSKIKSTITWIGLSRMEGVRCLTSNWISKSSIWNSNNNRWANSNRTWTAFKNLDWETKTSSTTQLEQLTWCLIISMSIVSPKSSLIGSKMWNSPL